MNGLSPQFERFFRNWKVSLIAIRDCPSEDDPGHVVGINSFGSVIVLTHYGDDFRR
jgi:hypothetical protein